LFLEKAKSCNELAIAMIRYREFRKQDVKDVHAVALAAWKYTYKTIYVRETIEKRVAEYYSDSSFESMIPRLKRKEAWFDIALDGGRVVGYANGGRRTRPWRSPFRNSRARDLPLGWELLRIYLLPGYIGKGIGRGLLLRWEEFLRRNGLQGYTVYVHSKNTIGKDFYRKSGLSRSRKLDRGRTSLCFVREFSSSSP
jgi:ribosomal protein S18 acetylase RimI-like enzyme